MRILLGLDRADAGSATIYGQTYRNLNHPMYTVGFTMDGSAAGKGHSARNHLKWVSMAAGFPMSRVDEVLALTGLESAADKRVGEFSLGMGQRLGLATALLGDPSVLVLDEPMNGLDPEGIRWMREFMRRQALRGVAILVSSHFMGEVEEIADDAVVIAHGRVVAQGTAGRGAWPVPYSRRGILRSDRGREDARMIRLLRSECSKLFTARSTWIIAGAMLIGTWGMSYLNAHEAVGVSTDDPRLYSNIPIPAEYNDFDMAGWGYVFAISLGAIWAASEYGRSAQIRTTLAATPRRLRVFAAKALLCVATVALLAFLSMSGGVMVTHYLAHDGIDPLGLNPAVWGHLFALAYSWAMVALLSFAFGVLTRSAIPSLAVLLPLVIGVGDFLAGLTPAFKYLPTVAAESMYTYAKSGSFLTPLLGGIIVGIWGLAPMLVAGIVFVRRDGA
ncbi:ATP-binding cassette domain-containing protein [Bifidobacterium subtile]|uniref:ATP-binding cassette domain-containing protein n=1 Tax=Bifidobacterium subtile TaxID=77635 RepID=UPI002F358D84